MLGTPTAEVHRFHRLLKEMNLADKTRLLEIAKASKIFLEFRSEGYAGRLTNENKPIAFMSHDSRDKTDIVRPLVNALQSMMVPIWYDEYSLKVGTSLRASIEDGLKNCEKCILILTPNFLNKGGWPKTEYEAIFTRELVEEKHLILPVWAGVSQKEVYDYSMILAGRTGLNWKLGVDEIAKRLFRELVPPSR